MPRLRYTLKGPCREYYHGDQLYAFTANLEVPCGDSYKTEPHTIPAGEVFVRVEWNQRTERFSRDAFCSRCRPFTVIES